MHCDSFHCALACRTKHSQIHFCEVNSSLLCELLQIPCCSWVRAAESSMVLLLFYFQGRHSACSWQDSCSTRARSTDGDFLCCSDGVHAVCRGLLRATAIHVLPDPTERAHLPAEEQAPHGGLWLQRLLYQLRPFSRSGTPSCSPSEAAAAGE